MDCHCNVRLTKGVKNSEADDGCLEEKKDGIELVVAFVARNGGGETGVKQEKRRKKAQWLA